MLKLRRRQPNVPVYPRHLSSYEVKEAEDIRPVVVNVLGLLEGVTSRGEKIRVVIQAVPDTR